MNPYKNTESIYFSPPGEAEGGDELEEVRQALDEVMRARYEGTDQSYKLWFEHLRLTSLQSDRAVFACESKLKAGIISDRFRDLIAEALEEVLGYRPALELTVDPSVAQIPREPAQDDPAERQVPLDETDVPEDAGSDGDGVPEDNEEADDGWFEDGETGGGFTFIRDKDGQDGRLDSAGRLSWTGGGSSGGDRPGYLPGGSRPGMNPPSRPADLPPDPPEPDNETAPSGSRAEKTGRPAFHDGYTFENFIVGSSNQMAHAAALSVADNVGMSINPLFIWGPSGLGKTHLMYAIANRAVERDPSLRVICVKGEEFMNEMIEAIRKDRNQAFRDKYRKTDMLLIDDIQFIAGKESTQTEFFHTFDALYEDRKQIIITSDRPPKDLTSLENRIRSRFEAGLLVDIQPPDYELRMAILRDKISQSGMEIPQDVLDFLAKNLQENIRQLEGVVKKLSVVHMVSGNPVTMETVLKTVPEYLRSTEPLSETVSRIIKAAADHYGVKVDDVLGKDRKKNIQTARNVSMYLVRTVTGASLPQIAVFFYRDHSTVHSNIAKVEAEIADDAVFEANVDQILKEIRKG